MRSLPTLIQDSIENFLLFLDYFFWLLLDPAKFKKIKKNKIKKVLIIHLGAFGEVLFTTVLAPALKKTLNCEVSILLSNGKQVIYKNNPHISDILIYKNNFKKDIKQIKNKNFDLVINIYPPSTKTSLICFLAKIKYRIGFFGSFVRGPSLFVTKKNFSIKKMNAVERTIFISTLDRLGIKVQNPELEFYLSNKEKKDLTNKLKKLKVKDYVVVHPGSSSMINNKYPSRLWPLERYSEIIDYLIEKYNFHVFITGSKQEKILAEKIKQETRNKKKIILANDLFNLRELAGLISKSRFLVSCGTCVVHFAAIYNIPSVIFAGKSNPIEADPCNPKKNYKLLYHNEVCTDCDKEYCRKKTIECLKAITVEETKNAIDELIKKNYKKINHQS